MGLHRLLGFTAAVPDPEGLAAFYGELGLAGDPVTGFTGSDGGSSVLVDEGDFRRLVRVEFGCRGPEDLDAVARRLTEGGAMPVLTDGELRVVDPASRVELVVRVAEPAPAPVSTAPVIPNAPGATVRVDERAPAVFGRTPTAAPTRASRDRHARHRRDRATSSSRVSAQGQRRDVGVIAFLRCSPDHHNVALVESPVPLLQHYSWECDDIDHVGHSRVRTVTGPTRTPHVGLGPALRRIQLLLVPPRPGRVLPRAVLRPGPDPGRRGLGTARPHPVRLRARRQLLGPRHPPRVHRARRSRRAAAAWATA